MPDKIAELNAFLKRLPLSILDAAQLAEHMYNIDLEDGFLLCYVVFDDLCRRGYGTTEVVTQMLYTASDMENPDFARVVMYWVNLKSDIGEIDEFDGTNHMTPGQELIEHLRFVVRDCNVCRAVVRSFVYDTLAV